MYVWVAELTKRVRVHYHVAMWVPKTVYLPQSDTCGWWPYGMTRTETARKPIGYIMKYVSKGTNDVVRHEALNYSRLKVPPEKW